MKDELLEDLCEEKARRRARTREMEEAFLNRHSHRDDLNLYASFVAVEIKKKCKKSKKTSERKCLPGLRLKQCPKEAIL